MKRKQTILALVLVAALAVAAFSTSMAGAAEEQTLLADFTAETEGGETPQIDGEQLGTNTLTVGELPPLTCSTIRYSGESTADWPSTDRVILRPEYETCHVQTIFGTRTATVALNGCGYVIEAATTVTESEEAHFVGSTDIECPEGNAIETTVYNTSEENDEGAGTLCVIKIGPQEDLSAITLSNDVNTPTSTDEIVANFNIESIEAVTTGGLFCGEEELKAVYEGEAKLQATNEAEEFVDAQMENKKRFEFGTDSAVGIGEGGIAEFTFGETIKVKCTAVKYEATPGARKVTELSVKPTYASCTAEPGGLETHIDPQECEIRIHKLAPSFTGTKLGTAPHTPGDVEIDCGEGESQIQVVVTDEAKEKVQCTISVFGGFPEGKTIDLKNIKDAKKPATENFVRFTQTLSGVGYEPEGEEAKCGKNAALFDGQLHGAVEVHGYSDAKKTKQVGLEMRGNM